MMAANPSQTDSKGPYIPDEAQGLRTSEFSPSRISKTRYLQSRVLSVILTYMKRQTKELVQQNKLRQANLVDAPESLKDLILKTSPDDENYPPLLDQAQLHANAVPTKQRIKWTSNYRLNTLMDLVFDFMCLKDCTLSGCREELHNMGIKISMPKLKEVFGYVKDKMKEETKDFSYSDPDYMVQRLRAKHQNRLVDLQAAFKLAEQQENPGQMAYIIGQVREEEKQFKTELQELGLMPKKIDQVPANIRLTWEDERTTEDNHQ